jgi:hypothetical protein
MKAELNCSAFMDEMDASARVILPMA